VRVSLSRRADLRDARPTAWTNVVAARDFCQQIQLGDLAPDTEYHARVETRGLDGRLHAPVVGRFRTAPRPGDAAGTSFALTSCQKATEVDDPEGFRLYDAMTGLDPRFFVSAGDVVYYDSDPPVATSVERARFHWQRMFGYPRLRRALLQLPGYWQKDDHDTWLNDGWPTQPAPPGYRWSYADGVRTFREQVPMGQQLYRTFRWGRTLQIWLTEGRDFRSPNGDPDGPGKSLWGATQRAWLESSLRQSDADWKILLSPTPIVGPDRGNKHDNHANDAFAHEGQAFRAWARRHLGESLVVLTGDRHWQYHSVHPETGTRELCPGAASDAHARGTSTSPGEDPKYHRFHRIAGGFVHVATSRGPGQARLRLTIRDVSGAVVHEHDLVRRLG
jgi:alkaline phosphatase D